MNFWQECLLDRYGGTLIIYIAVAFTTICIYKAVKKYGRVLVEDVVPKEKMKKVENKVLESPDKFENTLFILYFLPVIPKDFLTYVGSLLPISFKKFLIVTLLARFPAIISSTIAGSSILDGNIKIIFLAYGITYLVSFTIAFIYKRKSKKKKEIEEGQ